MELLTLAGRGNKLLAAAVAGPAAASEAFAGRVLPTGGLSGTAAVDLLDQAASEHGGRLGL